MPRSTCARLASMPTRKHGNRSAIYANNLVGLYWKRYNKLKTVLFIPCSC